MRYLVDGGAITSLGHDLPQTIASLRAGLDMFSEVPFAGTSQQYLQAAPVAGYAEALSGLARYEALTLRALSPIVERIEENQRRWIKLIVGLPRPDRPGVPADLEVNLPLRLAHRLKLDRSQIHCISTGRTAVFRGLIETESVVTPGEHLIIGGVDVLCDPVSLAALSADEKLKEEWDGFIPGDAAAFLRLSRSSDAGYWGRPAAHIAAAASTTDPSDDTKENPRTGEGLASVFAQAVSNASIQESEVELRINDLNGERTSFEDDAMATTRFFRTSRDESMELWHLGSYTGETGAAAGALELLWAAAAFELGFTSRSCALLSCSEERDRTAVVVLPPKPSSYLADSFGQVSLSAPVIHHKQTVEEVQIPDPGIRLDTVDDTSGKLIQSNFDELTSLLLIRSAHHSEAYAPWTDVEGFERRSLAHLDALAWNPKVTNRYLATLVDSGDLDPEEYAAVALVYGVAALDDKDIKSKLLELASNDDETGQQITTHLGLSPSQGSTELLLQLANPKQGAQQVKRALHALLLGQKLDSQVIESLIIAKRSDLLPTLFEVAAAGGHHDLADHLVHLHHSAQPILHPAQALGYLALTSNATAPPLFSWRQYLDEAPILAALFALRSGTTIWAALAADPTPEQAEAIGWSGETDAVPRLLALLDEGDEQLASAAAHSLNLILGANLYDEVELPPEPAVVDEQEDMDASEQLIEPVTAHRLSIDPAAWQQAYAQRGNPSGVRLRHGETWDKGSSLSHLRRSIPDCTERTWACWEHAIVTGAGFPLHPEHFVKTQRGLLANATTKTR